MEKYLGTTGHSGIAQACSEAAERSGTDEGSGTPGQSESLVQSGSLGQCGSPGHSGLGRDSEEGGDFGGWVFQGQAESSEQGHSAPEHQFH